MIRRIHWTKDEKASVLRRFAALRLQNPTGFMADLMTQAQDAAIAAGELKPERKRPMWSNIVTKLVGEFREHPSRYRPASAVREPAVQAVTEAQAAAQEPATPATPTPPARAEVDFPRLPPPDDPFDLLADAIQERGGEILAGILNHPMVHLALSNLVTTALGKQAPGVVDVSSYWPPEQVRVKHPKVLIAGLKGDQLTETQKLYGHDLDLRFWNKDQSYTQLRQLAKNADVAVGMVGFLSHKHDAILAGNAKEYQRVSASVSMLGRYLEQRFNLAPQAKETANASA